MQRGKIVSWSWDHWLAGWLGFFLALVLLGGGGIGIWRWWWWWRSWSLFVAHGLSTYSLVMNIQTGFVWMFQLLRGHTFIWVILPENPHTVMVLKSLTKVSPSQPTFETRKCWYCHINQATEEPSSNGRTFSLSILLSSKSPFRLYLIWNWNANAINGTMISSGWLKYGLIA